MAKKFPDVKVYYVGGFQPKESPTLINAKGGVYAIPPVGGYLEVPEYVARAIIQKSKLLRSDGSYQDTFTTNPRIAQAIAARQQQVQQPVQADASKMSKEQLLAALAALEESEPDEEDVEVPVVEPVEELKAVVEEEVTEEPKRRGRPKKSDETESEGEEA